MVNRKKPTIADKSMELMYVDNSDLSNTIVVNSSRKWFLTLDKEEEYAQARRRHQFARERLKAGVEDKVFRYAGQDLNRKEIMEHIIIQITCGYTMPEVLEDMSDTDNLLPTIKEINYWFRLHPDFKDEVMEALTYRAEKLNNMAVNAVMNVGADKVGGPTRDQVNHAKLIKETLVEQASFDSSKFQTKIKQQLEDVTVNKSPEEIARQIRELLKANPDLVPSGIDPMSNAIEVIPEEE